jgi:hypothetical protein
LAGDTPQLIESSSILPHVNATKAVSVFIKIVLRHVAPRATGFYVEE